MINHIDYKSPTCLQSNKIRHSCVQQVNNKFWRKKTQELFLGKKRER